MNDSLSTHTLKVQIQSYVNVIILSFRKVDNCLGSNTFCDVILYSMTVCIQKGRKEDGTYRNKNLLSM